MADPVTCLGDGHPGVWNLMADIATTSQRREILDWYHLKENLHKVGGSNKRLQDVETSLCGVISTQPLLPLPIGTILKLRTL